MDEIKKQLNEYLNNSIYNYGFLIKGQWGCGKSYFIRKFIKEYESNEDNKKFFICVSLNGLKDTTEIDINITTEIMKYIGKGALQLPSIKDIRKHINKENIVGIINKDYPNVINNVVFDYITDTINKENIILVFDDIERCDIEIKSLLAYINNYIEIQNLKVILIANEEELDKRYGDDYKIVKEKFIGCSLELVPDIELNYKSFICSIQDEIVREILENNKNNLLDEIKKQKHFNMRTVQFIIDKYVNFYNIVIRDSEFNNVIQVNEAIFKYLCFVAIRYKKGENLYNNWKNTEQGYINLDTENNLSNYIYGFKFIDEYITNGTLNKELILDTLLQFKRGLSIKHGPYAILRNNYWEMEDDDIYKNIDELEHKFESRVYNSSNILNCLMLVLILKESNYKIDLEKFINLFKDVIKDDDRNDMLYFTSSLPDFSRTSPKVKEEYIIRMNELKKLVIDIQFEKINEMIEKAEFEQIRQMVRTNTALYNFIIANGFYCNINIDKLINTIKKGNASTYNLMNFKYIFDELTISSQYINNFNKEEEAIDKIISELRNAKIEGSVSRSNAIKYIVENLESNKNAIIKKEMCDGKK